MWMMFLLLLLCISKANSTVPVLQTSLAKLYFEEKPIGYKDSYIIEHDKKVDWSLLVENASVPGICSVIKEWKNVQSISIDPHDYKDVWKTAYRYKLENNVEVFKGKLIYGKEAGSDTIELIFDILPSKPVILQAVVTYDDFWYDYGLFEYPVMTMRLYARNAKFVEFVSTLINLNNEEYFGCIQPFETNSDDVNYYSITQEFPNESTKLYTIAYNDFGYVRGDTVSFFDYVEDPLIRNWTGVEKTEQDPPYFYLSDRILSLSYPCDVNLYNMKGQCVLYTVSAQTINLSSLSEGLYILEIQDHKNLKLTKKIKL